MSDLQPRGVPVVLGGVERRFLFTLNAIDELQDKYYGKNLRDIMIAMSEGKLTDRMFREVVAVLLNAEAKREEKKGRTDLKRVSEEDVGDLVGLDNAGEVMQALFAAYGVSMPKPEPGADPNGKSGQLL